MSTYTGADVLAIATAIGAPPELARIMAAASMAEGMGDTEAVGDNGASWGPFQIYLSVHGLSREQACDLDFATRYMFTAEFQRAYADGLTGGYTGEMLCRYVCMAAERPWGWKGPAQPGLLSQAADNYARHWRELEGEPMPTTITYDPSVPAVRQTDPWSCSVASTAFMLHSIGIRNTYPALEVPMVQDGIVSPTLGLLDGSGGALADWLARTYGVTAHHERPADWDWLLQVAGYMPIALGSGSLYHWVAVRGATGDVLTLSNPAPGHKGVYDTLTAEQFRAWAPWACVWIAVTASEEEDMGRIADLENQVGYLKDAGRICREAIEAALTVKRLPQAARETLQYGALPAAQTVERGGPLSEDGE